MVDKPVDETVDSKSASESAVPTASSKGHPLTALGGGVSFYVSGEKGAGYEATARFWRYWPLDISLFAKAHTEPQLHAALVRQFRGQQERFAKLDATEAVALAEVMARAPKT